MSEPMNPADREELFELYSELHLACGRAAAALRLAEHWDAPEEELLARFQVEEDRAAAIWKRILALRDKSSKLSKRATRISSYPDVRPNPIAAFAVTNPPRDKSSSVHTLEFLPGTKMSEKYASAILRWRQYAGPANTWSSAAVSTILFGCQRWMETHASTSDGATRDQVASIKAELESWIAGRGGDASQPAS